MLSCNQPLSPAKGVEVQMTRQWHRHALYVVHVCPCRGDAQQLGPVAASMLTSKGFPSQVRTRAG